MLRLLVSAAAVLVLVVPSAAAAERVTLSTTEATVAPCQAGLLLESPAAVVLPYVAKSAEALTVRTSAAPGTDYDLALFDRATGAELASSAGFTASERSTVLLEPGQVVDVQACRRSGPGGNVDLELERHALTGPKPDAPQLVEVDGEPPPDLDVTHNGQVVVYSDADRAKLGDYRVVEEDLPAALRAMLRRDARRAPGARALPSGRTTYRAFGDYGTDLKAIADANPTRARQVTLAGASLEERPFEGVEIAADVGRPGDGRPILLITGLTHAREWPGGELAIEFAIDLASSTDPRMVALRDKVRVFVFPMANPDGFAVSRQAGAPFAAGDDRPGETTLPEALNDAGAYKRKNCRAPTPEAQAQPCASRVSFGVDLNRAYSAYWGGAGSSDMMNTQQYRGTAPFTEPEAAALRAFAQEHQTQVYITNHTYTAEGRVLRQPGFQIENDEVGDFTPDEPRLKALGDAMAEATQGTSDPSYIIGSITGPADDFFYYSQGTYAYTPELRGANFHTGYEAAVIAEYEGFTTTAGRGWREAYIVAGEYAANPADHVVLTGTAPPDATLRLRKDFTLPHSTDTDGDGTDDIPLETTPEKIDSTLDVRADGSFEWHVNPSKRPYGPENEPFVLVCERGGTERATRFVTAARGETKTFDFADCAGGGPAATPTPTPTATPGETATPTPTPSPTVTPTAGPAPIATPQPESGFHVRLRRKAFSARRINRRGALPVRVVLRGTGSVVGAQLVLRNRRGRAVLRGSAGLIARTTRVRLNRVRTLRRGRHRIILTGRTVDGIPVRARVRVRVRR